MKPLSRIDGQTVRTVLAGAIVLTAYPSNRLTAQGFPPRPPAPTALSPVRFPPFKEATLPNGLQLVVIEHREQPVVSVTLTFRAGDIYDPAGKEGLADLVAELLSKGTESRTAEQIAATIEGVGGSVSASTGDDVLTISAEALSDQTGLVIDLVGDVTLRSTFPDGELELARTRALSALQLQLSQPSSVAGRLFAQEIYGRNPYGRSPTPDSYRAITRDDVVRFAGERLRPAGALLVVAGDVAEPQVRALAQAMFQGWRGSPPPAGALPVPPAKARTDILLVHRPGSAQANIVIGNTTTLPTDPLYYGGRVVTQVLGGGPDARLFLILREQKSWTYGAYANLRRSRGIGYWQATAEVRTEVTDSALTELLQQVSRIRTEVVPDSELAGAKGFLVGSFPLTIETPTQIASQVANVKLLGLGTDYLRLYRERLAAVTAPQARAAAARLYRRSALTIVVVGDAGKLYDRLRAIAPVRMADIDGKALSLADLSPKAGPVLLDVAQLVPHSDSSRVLIQGNPLGATVTSIRRTADSLVLTEQSNLGSAFQQQTTILLDPADGAVRRLDQVTTQQGKQSETHLTYAGGRVKGRSVAPQPDGSMKPFDIDTILPPGTMDENAVAFVVPALPLAAGKTFTLSLFTPSEGSTKLLTFKVRTPESVTVPAGTFQAYRIDVSGSRVPFVMHVSTDTPRRVVKTEFVGQPFAVELVK
ncbi:MAG TPA: insulinase family protein [Gemmatimonadales bacterium]|nr:insulinase family protein [Gemmatimonadales bacterium]